MARITFTSTYPYILKICQFKCNPDFETAITARLNPKHVDERARIVQETTNEISQTVCCRWHVRRWGWVRPNTGEVFRRVGHGKVSTKSFMILLDSLHEMIWLDRHVEKKGPTHWSKRVCLGRVRFGNSAMLMHMHIWDLWNPRILLCVS